MIITFGGIKGGSGKTTLAVNTVTKLNRANTLLVDADEQCSASQWCEQRYNNDVFTKWTTIKLNGKAVHTELIKLRQNYDLIVIDTGGRDTSSQRAAMLVSDVYITPFQPRSFDIWTLSTLKKLIQDAKLYNEKLLPMAVLNRADVSGKDNEEASEIIRECSEIQLLNCVLTQRKIYANAASHGLSIYETSKRDQKAIDEFDNFIDVMLKSYRLS